jgi:hypothetical protein
LGYSESEFKRLESQGAFFRDLTEDLRLMELQTDYVVDSFAELEGLLGF